MAAVVNWGGGPFRAGLAKEMGRRIKAASSYLSSAIKADISQPGTLRFRALGKNGHLRKSQKTVYNFTHSRPGNPPFKQTGQLRRTITYEVLPGGLVGRVGTNLKYGRYLETGTRRGLAPRKYIVVNLIKHRPTVVSIITRRIGPGGLPGITAFQYRSGHFGRGASIAGWVA
jgi:hypothetical protein